MITPFTEDGIDYARMGKLLDFQAENGTAAVVIAGTTGEGATLSEQEYEGLTAISARQIAGRMKLIVGIGGNNSDTCQRKAKYARLAGADAVLMTPPYYNKTSKAGLIAHFLHVADKVDLPLILYNVPSRTAIGIPAEVYRALAKHPNVNGVKEASGDFSLISQVISDCGNALNVWSGNDDHTLPMMALGAQGVISVASNLEPGAVARLCALCLQGDYPAARKLASEYAALFRTLFVETNPIPVKAAMAMRALDSGRLRLPLTELDDAKKEALRDCLEKLP
jgi:4-hydroxy-tetrahydrodipicolinate synthase